MITWDDAQTLTQNQAADSTASSLVIFKQMMNIGYKLVLAELGKTVTEKSTDDDDIVTVASQKFYPLPMDCLFPKSVIIKVGTVLNPITECEDQEAWDLLNINSQTASVPDNYFVRPNWGVGGSEIGFYPAPATADYPILIVYEAIDKDLANDAYATGTVTFTSNDATITGSGTTFTVGMVGRYIYCSVDGFWYRIITFTDTTHVEIERVWKGTTTAGVTTNIREIFALPEEMQILPAYFALAHYFGIKKDTTQETKYWTLYNSGLEAGKRRWGTKTRSVITRGKGASRFPMWAPPFFPTNAT